MTEAEIARFCLSLPGAQEVVQWGGVQVFFVADRKMFATRHLAGDGSLAFKVDPELFLGYCDRPGFRPAPYLARAHWVSLEHPAGVTRQELQQLLTAAHQLVVARLPKRQQVGLRL